MRGLFSLLIVLLATPTGAQAQWVEHLDDPTAMPRSATADAEPRQTLLETQATPTRTSTFASRFASAITGTTVGSIVGIGGGALIGGMLGNGLCTDRASLFGCAPATWFGVLLGAAGGIWIGTWVGLVVGGGLDFLESLAGTVIGLLAAAVPAGLAIGVTLADSSHLMMNLVSGALFGAHNLVVFSALFGALLQGEPASVAPTVTPTVGGATVGLVGALD